MDYINDLGDTFLIKTKTFSPLFCVSVGFERLIGSVRGSRGGAGSKGGFGGVSGGGLVA